jgi:hypothetical protein
MSLEFERSEVAWILIGHGRKRPGETTCSACGSSRRAAESTSRPVMDEGSLLSTVK